MCVAPKELPALQKKAYEIIVSNLKSQIIYPDVSFGESVRIDEAEIYEGLNSEMLNNITIDTEFTEIGIDSITFIKTIVQLEDEFNFEFEKEALLIASFPTIKSLIVYVESKSNS